MVGCDEYARGESNTIKFYHRIPLVGASSGGWWQYWEGGVDARTSGKVRWQGAWEVSAGTRTRGPACTRAASRTGGSQEGDALLLHCLWPSAENACTRASWDSAGFRVG